MAAAAALLFACGAALTLAALILPHRAGPDVVSELTTSAAALACAYFIWRRRDHLRVRFFHIFIQVGNVLIAVGMVTGGTHEQTRHYAFLYLWGVLYASHFFSRRAALIHIGLAALLYGTVLLIREQGVLWISEWFVIMGSFTVAGLVVNWLTNQIHDLARNDALTGLPNRGSFEVELARALARAERDHRPLSVLLVDVDDFKEINDSEGHVAGDDFLRKTVAAWNERLRPGDVLARWGGDEFAAILPDCPAAAALEVAERLRAAMPATTCTIGAAEWNREEDGEALLSRADRALYEGKHRGRNRVAIEA